MVPKINRTNAVTLKQASKQATKRKQYSTCRDSHLVLFLSIMVYDDDTAQKHPSNGYQKNKRTYFAQDHDKRQQIRETGGTVKNNRNRNFKTISSNALYIGQIGNSKPLKRQETKRQAGILIVSDWSADKQTSDHGSS